MEWLNELSLKAQVISGFGIICLILIVGRVLMGRVFRGGMRKMSPTEKMESEMERKGITHRRHDIGNRSNWI